MYSAGVSGVLPRWSGDALVVFWGCLGCVLSGFGVEARVGSDLVVVLCWTHVSPVMTIKL